MRCTLPTSAKTSQIGAWRKFSSSTLLSGASLTDPRCAQLSVYEEKEPVVMGPSVYVHDSLKVDLVFTSNLQRNCETLQNLRMAAMSRMRNERSRMCVFSCDFENRNIGRKNYTVKKYIEHCILHTR